MVESNRVSLRAAEENPNAMSCGNALHAMSFLVVALPQSGRMQVAQSVLEHSQSIKPAKVYYTQLLGLADGDERPELVAARSKIAEKVSAATP
jgi:hypothetical protein